MQRTLFSSYYAQSRGLPNGYRRLEWIGSTKTQWIDTQMPGDQRIRLELDVAFTNVSGAQTMGLGSQSSSATRCSCGVVGGQFYAGIGNQNIQTAWPVEIGKRYRMFVDARTYTYGLDAATGSGGTSWTSTKTHLSLFTRSSNITDCPCACRLYGASLVGVSSVLRDFVPCVRLADATPGMFDTFNQHFFTNAGTGSFIVP